MTRLELNDIIMGAYSESLRSVGYTKEAEKVENIYAGQRAEIMANSGPCGPQVGEHHKGGACGR